MSHAQKEKERVSPTGVSALRDGRKRERERERAEVLAGTKERNERIGGETNWGGADGKTAIESPARPWRGERCKIEQENRRNVGTIDWSKPDRLLFVPLPFFRDRRGAPARERGEESLSPCLLFLRPPLLNDAHLFVFQKPTDLSMIANDTRYLLPHHFFTHCTEKRQFYFCKTSL